MPTIKPDKTPHQFFLFSQKEIANGVENQHPDNAYEATKKAFRETISHVDNYLNKNLKPDGDKSAIVVGTEDFFNSTSISSRHFFDMEAAYEMITTEFAALSKKYPNVVLCLGSMYISTDIPPSHYGLAYSQDDVAKKSLSSTVCYSAAIMPIFYNGELIRIVRKGEKAVLNGKNITDASELDNRTGKLVVTSYHEDDLTDVADVVGTVAKSSTCYLGKTLLPGERAMIDRYIRLELHECLASHEARIDDKSYIFVICGEFRTNYENIESTSGSLLTNNTYDYIIHSTIGGDLFEKMIKPESIYVHSDFGNSNKIVIRGTDSNLIDTKETDNNEAVQVKRLSI